MLIVYCPGFQVVQKMSAIHAVPRCREVVLKNTYFVSVALLCIVFAACGGTMPDVTNVTVIINNASSDAGSASSIDSGVVNAPIDAGDTISPTITMRIGFIEETSAVVVTEVSKPAALQITVQKKVGDVILGSWSGNVSKDILNTWSPSGLACGSTYLVIVSASSLDYALNWSGHAFDFFTTKACTIEPSPQLDIVAVFDQGGTPDMAQITKVGAVDVPVLAFKITASHEAVRLTKLTLTGRFQHKSDVANVHVYLDGESSQVVTPIASPIAGGTGVWNYTWTTTGNLLPSFIQAGSSFILRVRMDVGAGGAAVLGESINFGIAASADVEGKGVTTGAPAVVKGVAVAPHHLYIVPFVVAVSAEYPTIDLIHPVSTGTVLARVKVMNFGNAPVRMDRFQFTDFGIHSGAGTTYNLWYSDQNSTNYTQNLAQGNSAGLYFNSFASSAFVIDGGSWRYVTVTLNLIAASSGDKWQLSVAKLGDVTYTVAETDLGYDGDADGKLITVMGGLFTTGLPTFGTITKQ